MELAVILGRKRCKLGQAGDAKLDMIAVIKLRGHYILHDQSHWICTRMSCRACRMTLLRKWKLH